MERDKSLVRIKTAHALELMAPVRCVTKPQETLRTGERDRERDMEEMVRQGVENE